MMIQFQQIKHFINMKKTILLFAFLLSFTWSMSQGQQVINIGTSPNDHTGTTLRSAFDMCNDNFTELYSRQGPCLGTKYQELQNAIKYIQVNKMEQGDLYYIGRIINGTGSSPNLTYTIDIYKTGNFSLPGSKVMTYTYTGTALTGLMLMGIPQYSGSGRSCYLGVNWTLLITPTHPIGTTFTCSNFPEGGLYAVNVMPQPGTTGGGSGSGGVGATDAMIDTVSIDGDTIDTSKLMTVFNPVSAPITAFIEAFDSVKGLISLTNVSTTQGVVIYPLPTDTTTIQGHTCTLLNPGESLELLPFDSAYVIKSGKYVAP